MFCKRKLVNGGKQKFSAFENVKNQISARFKTRRDFKRSFERCALITFYFFRGKHQKLVMTMPLFLQQEKKHQL